MKITPEIIEEKEFKISIKGYDKKEINLFLDEIADEIEILSKDIRKLKDENSILLNQLAHYKKIENELSETFLKAQESAEQIREEAETEYKKKMSEADEYFREANQDKFKQIRVLEEKYSGLRTKYIKYRNSIKNDLKKQLSILENEIVE